MKGSLGFPEARGSEDRKLDAHSRLALIIDNVERLAEEAMLRDLPGSSFTATARRILEARAKRRQFFRADLFSDPAWDILLHLYALHIEQRRTSISDLALAANVPGTTTLRWLDRLQKDGLIEREADPLDGRRIWVAISDAGERAMSDYLRNLDETPPSA